jgi:hypothetical protein
MEFSALRTNRHIKFCQGKLFLENIQTWESEIWRNQISPEVLVSNIGKNIFLFSTRTAHENCEESVTSMLKNDDGC